MKLWIGLAGLKPKPKCKRFGKGKGAYVHIAAWAESREAFEEHVKKRVDGLDCYLWDFDDVGLIEDRIKSGDFPDEFLDIQSVAIRNPQDTVYGDFHVWERNDAN